jgi:hypothetical protein
MNSKVEGPDLEIFRHCSAQVLDRIKLQNKCVEMGIQVTSALAVAVGGVMYASMHNDPTQTGALELSGGVRAVIVIVLRFYVCIQLLLLGNYIYQTVSIMGHNYVYNQFFISSAMKFRPRGKASCRIDKWVGFLTLRLQALFLYFSVVLGLYLLGKFGSFVSWSCGGLFLWLIILLIVHLRAKSIPKSFLEGEFGQSVLHDTVLPVATSDQGPER